MSILPTFSHSGWVTNPLEKIDFMMAYFFETQKSQTHFYNDLASFQSILADGADLHDIESRLLTYLNEYLSTIFSNVELNVTIEPITGDENDVDMVIKIKCNFEDEGKTYSISNAIEMLGTNVKKIYRLNEMGEL